MQADAVLDPAEALTGAGAVQERAVPRSSTSEVGVAASASGTGDDDRQGVGGIGGQASRGRVRMCCWVGMSTLPPRVATLLLRKRLILPVGTGGTRSDVTSAARRR